MSNENSTPATRSSSGAESKSSPHDANRTNGTWRFGNVSIFCAWSPTAEYAAYASNQSEIGETPVILTEIKTSDPTTYGQPDETEVHVTEDETFIVTEEDVPLTVWRAKRISAVHIDEAGMFTLTQLKAVILKLIADARNKVAPKGIPLYYVLYIGAVNKAYRYLPLQSHKMRRVQETSATGGLAGRPILDIQVLRQLLDMLEEVRTEMSLSSAPEKTLVTDLTAPVIDAAYYEHYSPSRRCRGNLVFDPRFSLVIDCAEEDVRSLLTIVQQANLTNEGLAASGYSATLLRISLWDASGDMHASLDDLVQINRSSTASTQGQVLLSFALAGIGVLLALTPLPNARPGQLVAPMLIYAMSSIAHALLALTGKRIFNQLGIACLLIATALAILIFAVPSFVIPFLPTKP